MRSAQPIRGFIALCLVAFAVFATSSASAQSKDNFRLPPLDSGPPVATPPRPVAPAPPPPAVKEPLAPPSADVSARVQELKRKGNASMDNRLHAEALDYYNQAYALYEEPALLYNKGRALAGMGQYPEALDAFSKFQADASPELRAQVSGLDEFVASLRQKIATIEIRANVPEIEVRVRDEKGLRAVSSRGPIRINAGEKSILVTARGHFDYERKFSLAGGSTQFIDVTLTPMNRAMLTITSETLGSIVFIDGERVGNVPVDHAVSPGAHDIRIEKEGYEPGVTKVVVQAGDKREMTIPLTKTGLTSRWWFWTAIGAAALVGAGITIYAVNTPRDYDTGTICPPGPGPCRVSTSILSF